MPQAASVFRNVKDHHLTGFLLLLLPFGVSILTNSVTGAGTKTPIQARAGAPWSRLRARDDAHYMLRQKPPQAIVRARDQRARCPSFPASWRRRRILVPATYWRWSQSDDGGTRE